MATFLPAVRTESARQGAATDAQFAQRFRSEAGNMVAERVLEKNRQYAILLAQLDRIRRERMAKKAEAKAERAEKGGSIGSMVGTAAAVVAAPFTGGASLALIPAASQIGGGIGTTAAGGSGTRDIIEGASGLLFTPDSWFSDPGYDKPPATYGGIGVLDPGTATGVVPIGTPGPPYLRG